MPWDYQDDWRTLPGVHPTLPDPYCIWAALTSWADYSGPPSALRRAAVIIELANASQLADFLKKAVATEFAVSLDYFGVTGSATGAFLTASVTLKGLRRLADPSERGLAPFVKRFDLCDFVRPGRVLSNVEAHALPRTTPRPPLRGKNLIGMIDDGCAFAHASFFIDKTTRIAALWDQDVRPAFDGVCERPAVCYGGLPFRFTAGREIWRGAALTDRLGLDSWIAKYLDTTSAVDEQACYADASYPALQPRAVHGPHVMDVLAGPISLRQRMHTERDEPPSWGPASSDIAGDPNQSDIVFVQLPRAGLQDNSGGWLDSHVLDAIRYILSCRAKDTEHTVINLSYGSTVGAHDGSSILDAALADIHHREGGKLATMIAAGNSFSSRGHGVVELIRNVRRSMHWQIPPDSESPAFMQVWLPDSQIRIRVTPPGEAVASMGWFGAGEVATWSVEGIAVATVVYLEQSSRGDGSMVLIAVAPTGQEDADRVAAMCGIWKIDLVSVVDTIKPVHAYIARNDIGLGQAKRGRQSYFVDPIDDTDRFLRSPHDDVDAVDIEDGILLDSNARSESYVRRRGTLNGIATNRAVIVVGGYRRNFSDTRSDYSKSEYSSAGREDDDRGRPPTTTYPTDECQTLKGIRASGSRSGSTFRLVGTSVAVPQRARTWLTEQAGIPARSVGSHAAAVGAATSARPASLPSTPPLPLPPPACDDPFISGEECQSPLATVSV